MIRLLSTPLGAALTALGLLALGALAFALVSGDSGSDSPGGSAADSGAARGTDSEETTEEREAREAAERFYGLIAKDEGGRDSADLDARAFCELMSKDARRQTLRYVRRSSGLAEEWGCPSAVEHLVLRNKRAGTFRQARRAEVLAVETDGDEATASVRLGDDVRSIPLVREEGEWRLASSPAG